MTQIRVALGAPVGRPLFLFLAHDLARGYDMPRAEMRDFADVIRTRLGDRGA